LGVRQGRSRRKPVAGRWRSDGRWEFVAMWDQECSAGCGEPIVARVSWIVSSAEGKYRHSVCRSSVSAGTVRGRAVAEKRRRRYAPPRPMSEKVDGFGHRRSDGRTVWTAKADGVCPVDGLAIVAGVSLIIRAPDGSYVHSDCWPLETGR
jgi:hypothetical protein